MRILPEFVILVNHKLHNYILLLHLIKIQIYMQILSKMSYLQRSKVLLDFNKIYIIYIYINII